MANNLYVRSLSRNVLLGLRSVEDALAPAPELCERYGDAPLREGALGARSLLERLYEDMGARPSAYGIPEAPVSVAFDATKRRKVRAPFEAPLRLLYCLGLESELVKTRGGHDLVAHPDALASLCARFGLRDPWPAARALSEVGFPLEGVAEDGLVAARARSCGRVPIGLKAFAEVCRLWERRGLKSRQLPHVFLFADLRVLRRADGRAALPKLTAEDVLPWVPAERVADLVALIEHVESLGYRAKVEGTNVLDGEWHARYTGRAHGKALFGFTACRGELSLRLSCGNTERILPYVEQCPPALRDELLAGGCAMCGGAGCGRQVAVTVGGQERLICCYGILRASRWSPGDLEHLKRLLTVQDGLHSGRGG